MSPNHHRRLSATYVYSLQMKATPSSPHRYHQRMINPIVDLLALNFDTENLDLYVRSQHRLRREFYRKELLNLRIVSRTFCHIASPRLFYTPKLTHTLSSITGFLGTIQSPWVRHHVPTVIHEYWDPGEYNHNA
jgi:hypothetical protein